MALVILKSEDRVGGWEIPSREPPFGLVQKHACAGSLIPAPLPSFSGPWQAPGWESWAACAVLLPLSRFRGGSQMARVILESEDWVGGLAIP